MSDIEMEEPVDQGSESSGPPLSPVDRKPDLMLLDVSSEPSTSQSTPSTPPSTSENGPKTSGQKRSHAEVEDEDRDKLNGMRELDGQEVRVLQIFHPEDFYVRLIKQEKQKGKLEHSISNRCADPFKRCPTSIEKDDHLYVFCKNKKRWCRARVERTFSPREGSTQPTYGMFLFDYGIRQQVPMMPEIVKEADPELFDFAKYPPLSIHCALRNIRPLQNERHYSEEASKKMANLAGGPMVMHVKEQRSDTFIVDLSFSTVAAAVSLPSLAEALVYQGLVRFKFGENPIVHPVRPTQLRPVYPDRELLQIGSTLSIMLAQVDSPDRFFVNLLKNSDTLEEITRALRDYETTLNPDVWTYYTPLPNAPCVARFREDGRFYRALIESRMNEDHYSVLYVDFGNRDVVSTRDLRVIKDELLKYPRQAVPCRLADVSPAYAFIWSEAAIEKFKEIVSEPEDAHLTIRVLDLDEKQVPVVQLRLYDGQNDVNLNAKLCQPDPRTGSRVASSVGRYSTDEEDRELDSEKNVDPRKLMNRNQSNRNQWLVPLKISVGTILKEMYDRNKMAEASLKQSLIKVKITYAARPDLIYFRIDEPNLNEYYSDMEDKLTAEYKRPQYASRSFKELKQGEKVAFSTKEGGDVEWRRGIIVSKEAGFERGMTEEDGEDESTLPPGTRTKYILAVDYGIISKRKEDQIRPLNSNFLKDGPYACRASLHGVRPSGTSNSWSKSAIECLTKFFKEHAKETYILIKEFKQGGGVDIDIFGREEIVRGPVEPLEIKYHSLTRVLHDQGAIVVSHPREGGRFEFNLDEDDLNKNSEEYDRSSRRPMPFKLPEARQLGNLSRINNKEIISLVSRTPFQKYQASIYPEKKTFYATVSDIDPALNITFRLCQDVGVRDKIVEINTTIIDELKEKGSLPSYRGPLTSFAACSAYFAADKTWNRAEICGIIKAKSGSNAVDERIYITVRYVDYGQTDNVIIDHLSSKVFNPDIPKLALSAKLHGCRPKKGNSELCLNEMYKLLVDQKCRFEWVNYPNKPMKANVFVSRAGGGEDTIVNQLIALNLIDLEEERDDEFLPSLVNDALEVFRSSQYVPLRIRFRPEKFYPVVLVQTISNNFAYLQPNRYNPMVNRPLEQDEIDINKQFETFSALQAGIQTSLQYLRGYHERDERQLQRPHHVLAKYDDGDYYRSIILRADEETALWDVLFVDYGNASQVALQDIKKITSSLTSHPVNALIGKIINVRPRGNRPWTPEISRLVEDHLMCLASDPKCSMIARIPRGFVESNLVHFHLFQDIDYIPYEVDLYVAKSIGLYEPQEHALKKLVDQGHLEFIDPNKVFC